MAHGSNKFMPRDSKKEAYNFGVLKGISISSDEFFNKALLHAAMCIWGVWGRNTIPHIFEFAKKLVKR